MDSGAEKKIVYNVENPKGQNGFLNADHSGAEIKQAAHVCLPFKMSPPVAICVAIHKNCHVHSCMGAATS